ncbi:MAG TPA: aryl-sulfate sulfotransferase [Polyangiaceae bacterium]
MKARVAASGFLLVWLGTAACGSGGNDGSSTSTGSSGGAGSVAAGVGATAGGASSAAVSAGGTGAGTGGVTAGAGGSESGGSAGNGASGASAGGAGGTAGGGFGGGMGTALFTVDYQLASDVDADAPGTVGIVTWSVDVAALTAAYIEFGLDTTYGMTAPVDLAETDYRTLLLGMKPSSSYHFRIVAGDGASTYTSDDYVIETDPPTNLVSVERFTVMDEDARQRGFIVASYWQGQGSAVPFILDADGDIVWWYAGGPNGIARARMSEDGKNMWMVVASNNGGALRRVSMDGLDAQTYNGVTASHDITPVGGDRMAFLEYGESDCDSVYEIDPSGEAVEVFESQGVVESGGGLLGCHGNALRYSQAEDVYTFSDLNQDVLVVNRSGEVEWRLSERVNGGNDAWAGAQHGHQLLDGSILIFANAGGSNNSSAAVEYTLEGEEIMRYVGGNFTQNLGDVQRLPNGNTLVNYGNDSVIREIDADENVVLEIEGNGSSFGYTLWRETLYGPPPNIQD